MASWIVLTNFYQERIQTAACALRKAVKNFKKVLENFQPG